MVVEYKENIDAFLVGVNKLMSRYEIMGRLAASGFDVTNLNTSSNGALVEVYYTAIKNIINTDGDIMPKRVVYKGDNCFEIDGNIINHRYDMITELNDAGIDVDESMDDFEIAVYYERILNEIDQCSLTIRTRDY